MSSQNTRAVFVGTGGMARYHLSTILANFPDTQIPFVCEPSAEQYKEAYKVFQEAGCEAPVNYSDLESLLKDHVSSLDAIFIITPHVFHHEHTKPCLEADLDVLLEKPLVINAEEASSLIQIVKETGKLLVVAFKGSLSTSETAEKLLCSGDLGALGALVQPYGRTEINCIFGAKPFLGSVHEAYSPLGSPGAGYSKPNGSEISPAWNRSMSKKNSDSELFAG